MDKEAQHGIVIYVSPKLFGAASRGGMPKWVRFAA
jgi:hypothetical protein